MLAAVNTETPAHHQREDQADRKGFIISASQDANCCRQGSHLRMKYMAAQLASWFTT